MRLTSIFILLLLSFAGFLKAQERPFIWVNRSDREQILNKIESEGWAKSSYQKLIAELEKEIEEKAQEIIELIEDGKYSNIKKKLRKNTAPMRSELMSCW